MDAVLFALALRDPSCSVN